MTKTEPLATNVLDGIDAVAVTGASGFIGNALAERLEGLGKRVVRISRHTGIDLALAAPPLDGVGHIFHAAGRTGVVAAWDDPVGYLEVNALGTARVLEQCRRLACGITFASGYIYGKPNRLPITEDHSVDANNPYAFSKYIGEKICLFFHKTYGVPVVIVRLFNVYGPGQKPDFLIPLVINQILDPKRPEIEVMDLSPRRDYIHISDVVDGILLSTHAAPGSVFNLGSGEAHSVEDVIRLASAAAGTVKPYHDRGSRRRGEIDSTVADISALKRAVGWCPRVSLAAGLRELVHDMRQQCER